MARRTGGDSAFGRITSSFTSSSMLLRIGVFVAMAAAFALLVELTDHGEERIVGSTTATADTSEFVPDMLDTTGVGVPPAASTSGGK